MHFICFTWELSQSNASELDLLKPEISPISLENIPTLKLYQFSSFHDSNFELNYPFSKGEGKPALKDLKLCILVL